MLIDSILTNYHAFMQCESPESLPVVECGSLPQQRYHLRGQSSIKRIAISIIPKRIPQNETPSNETPSMSETPDSMSETPSPSSQTADSSFEVIAAGSFPFLCFYEISRDSPNRSVGSLAVSVAKSLYGAVRSLAGWGWNQAETEKRETIPTAKPVRTSFELADHKREGTQIWGSPSGRFIAVSDGLNRVVLVEIYAAREKNIHKISSSSLVPAIKKHFPDKEVHYFPTFEEIAEFVNENSEEGDLIITMGAGDVYKIGEMLIEKGEE